MVYFLDGTKDSGEKILEIGKNRDNLFKFVNAYKFTKGEILSTKSFDTSNVLRLK